MLILSLDTRFLAAALQSIKGKFIMSLNDKPEVRELFEGFAFEDVRLKYTVAKSGSIDAREVLISNCEARVSLI